MFYWIFRSRACYTSSVHPKISILLALIGLVFAPLFTPAPIAAASPRQADGWTELAPGVDYREFALPGPVRVYVARMLIADPDPGSSLDDVILESAVAHGQIGRLETVRGMAARYDDAINFWGEQWGDRNDVVVAINGSYFGRTDTPENGMVQSGWYLKRYADRAGGSGLVWTLNRQVFIGDCVVHPPEKQIFRVDNTGRVFKITSINVERGDKDIVLYTPQFGAWTPQQSSGVEIVVQLSRPLLIIPPPGSAVVGTVKEIRESKGTTPILFNSVVLSAGESQRAALAGSLAVGDTLRFNQEITGYLRDCQTTTSLPWTKAYAGIGAALHLLQDGTSYPPGEDNTRAPRTAIAYDAAYIYFIVVDGRQPDFSIGMTFQELADFILYTLEARDAVAQDGGGSSTMVVNGIVVNRPSDICYRIFLPIVQSPENRVVAAPQPALEENFEPDSRLQYGCERRVANAILIARVAPRAYSGTSFGGNAVFTTRAAPLRVGPGTNYPALAIIPAGSYGEIQMDEAGFNGILAKSAYWWKVSFNGQTGWMAEDVIATLAPRYSIFQNLH